MIRNGSRAPRAGWLALGIAAAIVVAAAEANAQTSSRSEFWFPLDQGNSWRFVDANDLGGPVVHEIRCELEYGPFHYVTGIQNGANWLYQNSRYPYRNNIYVYNEDQGRWYSLYRFGIWKIGREWRFDLTGNYCDTLTAHWQENGVSLSTPAGDFSGCRRLDYGQIPEPNARCAKPPQGSVWFAPQVGPVRIALTDGRNLVLRRARVGNVTYPRVPSGQIFTTTLILDQASYVNYPNTIRCVRAPCPSNEVTAVANFTLRVTNNSGHVQVLHFRNGQQFDFDVYDPSGNLVRRWSDGRFFTQAATTVSFSPGETKDFTASLDLKDSSGQQLDGTYTVLGWITAGQVQGLSARAQLVVTVQYQ